MVKAQELKIIVDSREQHKLWDKDIIIKKLCVGDYSFMYNNKEYDDEICIERKSGADAFGTAASGHNRFNKEIERSKTLDYFAVVIEEPYTTLLQKKFDGAGFCKMRAFIILKTWFTWHMKHNIPLFFTQNRVESKMIIREIFRAYLQNKR
jgi:ERCC4-type nuclease